MPHGPAFSHSYGADADAKLGVALWQARPPLLAMLVTPLLVALMLSPLWGMALSLLLDPSSETATAALRVAGIAVALDQDGAHEAHYGLIAVLLLWPLILGGSALIRKMRLRYRLDAQAVEMWRGATLVQRIALGDVEWISERSFIVWHGVRVHQSPKLEIAMQLRAADARRLLALLHGLGVEPGEPLAAPIPEIAPTERVRWQGRPGLAALNKLQLVVAPALFLPALIYALPLQWFWTSGLPFRASLFFSLIWTMLMGGVVVISLFGFGEVLGGWTRAAFGTLLVTDRRIAWRVPGARRIYRALALSELVDAVIVERKGRRAWVALTLRHGSDDVREEDLRGIPDADRFVATLGVSA